MNVEFVITTPAAEWDRLRGQEHASETKDREFVLLVERQARFVFRIAYVILRNVEDAEDTVQETFLRLFRSGAWRRIADPRAFLARVAWRLATSKIAARRTGLELQADEIHSREGSPEQAAIAGDSAGAIHKLIDSLPEKLRRPLALSSVEEMTAAEIAQIMEIPESSVRRLLSEARALVKEKLRRMERGAHA